MQDDEFKKLAMGDVVRKSGTKVSFVVQSNTNGLVLASRIVVVDDAFSWDLLSMVTKRSKETT